MARRGCDAPSRAGIARTCRPVQAAAKLGVNWKIHHTSKISHGWLFKFYMGILIMYIKVYNMEDFILQNHKPKTLRKYPKTSIEVQL